MRIILMLSEDSGKLLSTLNEPNYNCCNLEINTIFYQLISYIFKIGKECNKLCNFCILCDETIFHSLWESPNVQELIQHYFEFCKTKLIIIQKDHLI